MQFGVFTKAYRARLDEIGATEDLGFSEAWFPDFQLLGGDPYVAMAIAAERTRRLGFCVAVTNPLTRHVAVTANAVATLNEHHPGRVAVGIGTGSAPMKAMGISPAGVSELEDYARTCGALLRGEVATVGDDRQIRFLSASAGALRTDPAPPVRIAAGGPRALTAAGRVADEVILGTIDPDMVAVQREYIERGAREVGRATPSLAVLAALFIGEPRDLEELVEHVGGYVPNMLFGNHRIPALHPDRIAEPLREAFAAAADAQRQRAHRPGGSQLDEYERYLSSPPEWQRRLLSREAIEAKALVGSHERIAERLGALAEIGVRRVVLYPNERRPDAFHDFSAQHIR